MAEHHTRHNAAHIAYKLDRKQRSLLELMADETTRTADEMSVPVGGLRIHQSLVQLRYLRADANGLVLIPQRWGITNEGLAAVAILRADARRR